MELLGPVNIRVVPDFKIQISINDVGTVQKQSMDNLS